MLALCVVSQAVADIVTYYLSMFGVQHGTPSVHTAATFFQELCYSNKDRLSAGIIVAGWDKRNGSSVYNIPLGGGLFQQPWAIGGELRGPPQLLMVYWNEGWLFRWRRAEGAAVV